MKDLSYSLSCRLFSVTQSTAQLTTQPPVSLPLIILGATIGSSILTSSSPAWSQSTVSAADDGTGTVVTQQSSQIEITGGSQSADGENLFHSFETFSVDAGDRTTFITEPTVQNVLTRVSGGSASSINGEIAVTGSQANFFFMNPAGILVGPEASLNLPANLTLTTADAIGFDTATFSANNNSDYTALNNAPTGKLFFNAKQPSIILNQGTLSVAREASLNLIGNTVINQGELSAPSGNITVAAVPGESTVRLSQNNSLLSLEIAPTHNSPNNSLNNSETAVISPIDLPALLTYGEQTHANTLTTDPDGTVHLSGTLTTSALTEPETTTAHTHAIGGDISITGEHVILSDATLSADGAAGGGNLYIGGEARGQGTLPTASQTYISASTQISADATLSGNGGQITVWADDTTQYLGNISATGGQLSGNGGFVEVSGKESLTFTGTVDTSAANGEVGSLLLDPRNIFIVDTPTGAHDEQIADYSILADDGPEPLIISASFLENLSENADILLEATNDISILDLADNTLNFAAAAGDITFTADADNDGSGSVVFQGIDDALIAPGRSLNLSGRFLYLGDVSTAHPQRGGNINLNARIDIRAGNIDTTATAGPSGNVTLTANKDIIVQSVSTNGHSESGMLSATSQQGDITIEALDVMFIDNANISAPGEISIEGLDLPNFIETLLPRPSEPSNINNNLITQLSVLSASSSESSNAVSDTKSAHAANAHQQTTLTSADADAAIAALDQENHQLFSDYFGRELATQEMSLEDVQSLLTNMEQVSNTRSAIVYVTAPEETAPEETVPEENETTLELLFFTADDAPIQTTVPEITQETLLATVKSLRSDLATSSRRGGDYYLEPAQQLHQWLIDPIQSNLDTAAVDTLIFVMDEGLRTLPIGALHSGSNYLAESYSLGIVPSLGMLNAQYSPLVTAEHTADVLAMGISNFDWHSQFETLPNVPQEIDTIVETWPATGLLDKQFTKQALIEQRQQIPYSVIHFATHASFQSGTADSSYIQLWDEKLLLSELSELGWRDPSVDLLVLSACNTAVDSPEAEMGFAGLAIASGVSSAMASLWSVSDAGTLALMETFYQQLRTTSTKAEALQLAQLALLESDFSHPYYWSGFTMIGSPW